MERQTYSQKAVDILDAAERHMRSGGFDAVSFRELASEVGIKSASVHYHFPQKADLGEAVVHRYTEHVLAALGAPDDPSESIKVRIERLCAVYRSALLDDGLVCLCCVLGAEQLRLPNQVADAVGAFFTKVLAWTNLALSAKDISGNTGNGQDAAHIIASLQGAMILALATKRPELFTDTASRIIERLST